MEAAISVAVVDDEPGVRAAYRAVLDRCGEFRFVGEAPDGGAGVTLYRERRPDVMLMDIKMPVMSGVEAIEAICRDFPTACVVALTTSDAREHVTAALRAGASGYLLKGCTSEELTQALHQAMAGEMPLAPAVRRVLVESIKAESVAHPETTRDILTEREVDLLHWLALGLTNQEIAQKMFLSEGSVKQYLSHIADKLGVRSRTQVLVRALQLHLIDLDDYGALKSKSPTPPHLDRPPAPPPHEVSSLRCGTSRGPRHVVVGRRPARPPPSSALPGAAAAARATAILFSERHTPRT